MNRWLTRGRKLVDVWTDVFARHNLLTYASAIAFQVLKSLIPLSLLGIALLGVVGRQDVWTTNVAPAIEKRLDAPIYHAIDYAVKKIFAHNSGFLLVFAALLTIWYVSGAVRGTMGGINRIYEVDETRPVTIRWLLSIGLAICITAGIVGAGLLVEVVPTPGGAARVPVMAVRWLGAVAALAAAAGVLIHFAPAESKSKRWASAGGALIVLTWIVTTLVFRWYVGSIANFKTAIGQLTVFIVLMAYVYASSIVFLVGVELDEMLRHEAKSGARRGVLGVLLGTTER
jgi:membrane protein